MLKEEGEPPSGRTSCGDARKNHASAVARNGLGLNRQLTGPAIGRGKGWTPAPPHSPADSPPPTDASKPRYWYAQSAPVAPVAFASRCAPDMDQDASARTAAVCRGQAALSGA